MSSRHLPGPALLFCPGDRPERYDKALAAADVVVIDLEDAVAPSRKEQAREALIAHPVDYERVVVRVNAISTADHAADLEAVRRTSLATVMLAKSESAAQVAALAPLSVVALCETPAGILAADAIASVANVIALMVGAEDLAAALGARSSRTAGGALQDVAVHARSRVLLAAKANGRQAIDTVYPDLADIDGLLAEALTAAENGFDLKACIHPRQVDAVRSAFLPTDEAIAYAMRVMAAAAGGGVTSLDGRMIDGPIVAQARRTLDLGGVRESG